MATGTVKFFSMTKGFGFITPDDESGDAYINWKRCEGTYVPAAGDIVEFDVRVFEDGRRMAKHVRLAG